MCVKSPQDHRWAASLALVAALAACQRQSDFGKYAEPAAYNAIRTAIVAGGGPAGAAAGPTGTGWGTLKGRFTYVGDPPAMQPYGADKDMDTCAPGGHAPLQQTLVVDSATKGIANVVIFVRKASRVHESAVPKTETVVFDQKECVFLTHVLGVTVGQSLDIKNSDPVGHNTNISGQNSFNEIVASGGSTAFPVKKEEGAPAAVSCSIHPWMRAYLLPRKNGYFAVTAPDGSFEIANLPAGEPLEFQVWHESAPGANHALFVDSPEAKELKWNDKGRFKVTLEVDGTREINLAVPPGAFGG